MKSIARLALGLTFVVAMPGSAQTKEEAEAFVKSAVAFAKTHGGYKLIKEVNSPETQFKKGELYIWIVDMDGVMVAHGANPKLVGRDMGEAHDANDIRFTQEAVKIAQEKGSGWFEYQFMNPETKKIQPKICFVEKYQTLAIACGIYKK